MAGCVCVCVCVLDVPRMDKELTEKSKKKTATYDHTLERSKCRKKCWHVQNAIYSTSYLFLSFIFFFYMKRRIEFISHCELRFEQFQWFPHYSVSSQTYLSSGTNEEKLKIVILREHSGMARTKVILCWIYYFFLFYFVSGNNLIWDLSLNWCLNGLFIYFLDRNWFVLLNGWSKYMLGSRDELTFKLNFYQRITYRR